MSPEDQFLDLPSSAAAAAEGTPLAFLSADEIGETELFGAASYIYAHLVSVPRTIHEQQLLDLRFQELGYENTTHALQVGAVQAAFNMRDAIKKRLEKEGAEPNV